MRVVLAGAAPEFIAITDQRDLAALEATEHLGKVFTSLRFMAWNAARRAGQYGGSWDDFNLRDCVEVTDVDADGPEDSEGEQGSHPGTPGQSATG